MDEELKHWFYFDVEKKSYFQSDHKVNKGGISPISWSWNISNDGNAYFQRVRGKTIVVYYWPLHILTNFIERVFVSEYEQWNLHVSISANSRLTHK